MRGSVVVRILVVARAVVDIAMRVASVPGGGDVARDHLLKRAALLGHASRKYVDAREPRLKRTCRGNCRYRRALESLQGAGRLLLAVFGILAYHGFFALALEGDLQRRCPEIGREHKGNGFPACACELGLLGDGTLHGPLFGLMLIAA